MIILSNEGGGHEGPPLQIAFRHLVLARWVAMAMVLAAPVAHRGPAPCGVTLIVIVFRVVVVLVMVVVML
jgi:hypothetical protein